MLNIKSKFFSAFNNGSNEQHLLFKCSFNNFVSYPLQNPIKNIFKSPE
jgi:hypothetical protein